MAALIDVGVHFVNATYYLEGDGPLIFSCYEHLSAVAQAVAVDHYPNTDAVAREIANGNVAIHNQLMAQAKACIRPGLNFYQRKFSVQFRDTVRAFKAARFCCPVQVQALCLTSASLEELKNFPFVNNATIANLAQELPLYIAAADGVNVTCEEDKVTWWAAHRDTLPHWYALVKKRLLIQPSSAAAERVYSLLSNAFMSQQDSALQDYLEASVMLRYNKAKRV